MAWASCCRSLMAGASCCRTIRPCCSSLCRTFRWEVPPSPPRRTRCRHSCGRTRCRHEERSPSVASGHAAGGAARLLRQALVDQARVGNRGAEAQTRGIGVDGSTDDGMIFAAGPRGGEVPRERTVHSAVGLPRAWAWLPDSTWQKVLRATVLVLQDAVQRCWVLGGTNCRRRRRRRRRRRKHGESVVHKHNASRRPPSKSS